MLLSATLALAGCIVLPIPTSEDKVLAGTPVADTQLGFLAPGQTTEAEVVERLGPPALVWEDARVFVYPWDMRKGILLWAAGAYYAGGFGKTDLARHHLLLIRFDEGGRVARFESLVRPSGVSLAGFIREWLGVPAASPAVDRALVLIRIDLSVDGAPASPFPRPSWTAEPLFAFGLGDFESAARLSYAFRQEFLSDDSRRAGWVAFRLTPGTWHLGMIGPDSAVPSLVARFGKQDEDIPRWRIEVPEEARLVYAGTLRVMGRTDGRYMFGGGPIVKPAPGHEAEIVDERELAAAVLAAQPGNEGPLHSAPMKRLRQGETMVFRSPLPALAR